MLWINSIWSIVYFGVFCYVLVECTNEFSAAVIAPPLNKFETEKTLDFCFCCDWLSLLVLLFGEEEKEVGIFLVPIFSLECCLGKQQWMSNKILMYNGKGLRKEVPVQNSGQIFERKRTVKWSSIKLSNFRVQWIWSWNKSQRQ